MYVLNEMSAGLGRMDMSSWGFYPHLRPTSLPSHGTLPRAIDSVLLCLRTLGLKDTPGASILI